MIWHTAAAIMFIIAGIFAVQALFGDPEKAQNRWLTAIFFKLSAILDILWLISIKE